MSWANDSPTQQNSDVEELRNALGVLNGRDKLYCSNACLKRYLRARNGNMIKAKNMLKETLKWRNSYKPEDILWVINYSNSALQTIIQKDIWVVADAASIFFKKEDIAVECETGKMYRASFTDRLGRPVVIMIPRNQNTDSHDGQLKHLVYTMENATLYLPADQEQFLWIIDFEGWSLSKASPLKTVRETANILQNHYPERLAVGIMLNAPKIFEYTWKLWKPFVDPTTYQKARFVYTSDLRSLKTIEDLFDQKSMEFNFKGQYKHTEYSQLMQADDLKKKAFWDQADSAALAP